MQERHSLPVRPWPWSLVSLELPLVFHVGSEEVTQFGSLPWVPGTQGRGDLFTFICQMRLRVGKRQAAGWEELDWNQGLAASKAQALNNCPL